MKPLTLAKIHSVLRKAGHRKSCSQTTRVRGWYSVTDGYVVRPGPEEGTFVLWHKIADYGRDKARQVLQVQAYREAFEGAGIVILSTDADATEITVGYAVPGEETIATA